MEYKRFTEKRNGKNVIPLRNAVCGVGLPKWSIEEHSDVQSFLSGDSVDRLAELEDKIEQGTLIEVPYKFGSTLYFIVINKKGGELSIFETDLWVYHSIYVANEKGEIIMGLAIDINDTSFDEETFVMVKEYATREEAEKRLKELQE